jgi:hypothetical protein
LIIIENKILYDGKYYYVWVCNPDGSYGLRKIREDE